MYFSHIYLNVPFNYVFLSRLLYSTKGISATDILPVICLGSDVALNKSKFIIIIIIIIIIFGPFLTQGSLGRGLSILSGLNVRRTRTRYVGHHYRKRRF